VSAGIVAYGWSDDPQTKLREGRDAALRAIHLDEKNPYAHYGLAIISAYSDDCERAKRAAEQAIERSPSFALGHLVLGMARLYSGDTAGAIPSPQHGLRLSPYDPQNFVWYRELALAHLFAGEPQLAIEAVTKALKVRPDWLTALEIITICLVASGRQLKFESLTIANESIPAWISG
jgi:tetratricopeptide (TPR) repeat protein